MKREKTERTLAYHSDWGTEEEKIFSYPSSAKGSGMGFVHLKITSAPSADSLPSLSFKLGL